ncbi:MAG: thiamine-phosphate kinase [Thiotrichales bacterium]|nr:MAG: thiamine-phosphate kinase [Thiotrichales bacterium]
MASGEFNLIKKYFVSPSSPNEVILGVGDDCAVVAVPEGRQLAITTDTLVAGVHFPLETSAADIACKAIAVNLSDLAAMGAEPAWLTLALTLPGEDTGWLESFSESFRHLAKQYHLQLVGGDTTQGPMSITLQAIGFVDPDKIMRRDAARAGDAIYVSGTLGDAAAGLKILEQGGADGHDQAWLVDRLNRPEPRVELGMRVSGFCKCAIDISDGLAADLGHILEASHCGATLDIDRLPLSRQLVEYSAGRDTVDWNMVLSGGDDYELCLVVTPENEDKLMAVASRLELPLTHIGVIEAHDSLNIVDQSGARYLLDNRGYEHFSR